MRVLVFAAAVLATAAPARADEPEPLVVELGKTVKREVGFAMGHICDDETIVRAEMQNGTAENNLFVVTGKKLGTTTCRAGTVQNRPQIVFAVSVIERKPDPAPKPKPPARR